MSASESDEEPLQDEDDDSSKATNEFEDEVEKQTMQTRILHEDIRLPLLVLVIALHPLNFSYS